MLTVPAVELLQRKRRVREETQRHTERERASEREAQPIWPTSQSECALTALQQRSAAITHMFMSRCALPACVSVCVCVCEQFVTPAYLCVFTESFHLNRRDVATFHANVNCQLAFVTNSSYAARLLASAPPLPHAARLLLVYLVHLHAAIN